MATPGNYFGGFRGTVVFVNSHDGIVPKNMAAIACCISHYLDPFRLETGVVSVSDLLSDRLIEP